MPKRGLKNIDQLEPKVLGIEPYHPVVWQPKSKSSTRSTGYSKKTTSQQPQAVIVKCEIVTHGRSAVQNLSQHARYLERDGDDSVPTAIGDSAYMSRRGQQSLFGPGDVEGWAKDRHHFRIIVSPERGDRLNMHQFVHELVQRIQKDQQRSIAWRAVVHHDSGTPHAHILMRGRDSLGRFVSIPIDYLYHQLRSRAAELATERLGTRSPADIEHARAKQTTSRHFTELDQELEGKICRYSDLDRFAQARVDWLAAGGLAQARGFGVFKVSTDLAKHLGVADRTRSRIGHEIQRGIDHEPD